jgi:hypothetical protein
VNLYEFSVFACAWNMFDRRVLTRIHGNTSKSVKLSHQLRNI